MEIATGTAGLVEKYIWYTCIQFGLEGSMGSTVRVRDEDKEKLEKLRALATLASCEKITQEELLGVLLDDALSHGESFLTEAFGERRPVFEKEFERILGLVSDWGVETSPEEIDRVLYGTGNVRRKK